MSKKNINRILIVVVALIWGVLIYKFVSNMIASNTSLEVDTVASQQVIDIPLIEKDTFNLKSYERDPFLGTLNRTFKPTTNNSYKTVAKKEVLTNQKWPKIAYLGFVKEEKSNDPLLLVKINDRLYRKKANGEFIEGLKIVSFYKDSLQVKFNNERRMIKKN